MSGTLVVSLCILGSLSPPAAPPPPHSDVYQFVFTSVRDQATKMLSLSEVKLYDELGDVVSVREAHNPGGQAGNKFETPQAAIDGSVDNKC